MMTSMEELAALYPNCSYEMAKETYATLPKRLDY